MKIKKRNLAAIILVFIFLIAILIFSIFNLNTSIREENVQDNCGIFVGRIFHTIKDAQDCEQQCRVRCDAINLNLRSFKFLARNGSCNECSCKCI